VNRAVPIASTGSTPASNACPRPAELTDRDCGVVLWVSHLTEDHLALQRICGETGWRTLPSHSYRGALAGIQREKPDVILCEASLPDGTWKDLLAAISGGANPPYLIVTSHLADERLWAEALNLGAYDVLVTPFDPVEVYRVVGAACRHHRERHAACVIPAGSRL